VEAAHTLKRVNRFLIDTRYSGREVNVKRPYSEV
jgi:DNA-binding sugar fermentation-stimulating protein